MFLSPTPLLLVCVGFPYFWPSLFLKRPVAIQPSLFLSSPLRGVGRRYVLYHIPPQGASPFFRAAISAFPPCVFNFVCLSSCGELCGWVIVSPVGWLLYEGAGCFQSGFQRRIVVIPAVFLLAPFPPTSLSRISLIMSATASLPGMLKA